MSVFSFSDKIKVILSEKRPILFENSFFRTNFGQKFVKFAQETLKCQMNISSSVSDKWIFERCENLCVYSFLIFESGLYSDLSCFHDFSLELLI